MQHARSSQPIRCAPGAALTPDNAGAAWSSRMSAVCRHGSRSGILQVPPVFETLRRAGQVPDGEMFRTFNMGIGYVLVVPSAEGAVLAALTALQDLGAVEIGEIVSGERGVELA
ncbi:MAG: hypothetical protein K6T92_07820 [Candidatus Rokubacteria bacterium]|nr:hypothetical protein [Candidatus Rokubacteria bacterium]